MSLFAVGLNHSTAPLDVRERVVFTSEILVDALRDVVSAGRAKEAAILSTCNRTEVYFEGDSPAPIASWLAGFHGVTERGAIPEQGIAGFIDYIFLPNYRLFAELTESWTQQPVRVLHRRSNAATVLLDRELLRECETLIVLSFDTRHSDQEVTPAEAAAVREFLAHRDHAVFVCPHHDIGDEGDQLEPLAIQKAEFEHRGDKAIPGRQRFGYFALSLMRSIEIPIRNRFGFRPATAADGQPLPLIRMSAAHAGLLTDLSTLNLHPHLPHFERLEQSVDLLEVVVRQSIDERAAPHPFASERLDFDSVLQSRADLFEGALFVTDATLWNSASGGLNELQKLWRNVALGKVAK